ncbi:hypothetical protein C4D60_Mb02t01290 [Musa balbisiana]|uniref:Uncharacterized protein n=1 Tax=Musa balbisiana TaxID=52838 RepID=A0A4S8I7F3_MUSBA|nr:hypothetical protein C4D60_Mb02t01290 [Musa balbisiana]
MAVASLLSSCSARWNRGGFLWGQQLHAALYSPSSPSHKADEEVEADRRPARTKEEKRSLVTLPLLPLLASLPARTNKGETSIFFLPLYWRDQRRGNWAVGDW